jgi:hypothetical protein
VKQAIHTTPQLSGFFQTVVICHLQQPKYQSPVSPQAVVVANPNHNTDFSSGFPRTVVIVNCLEEIIYHTGPGQDELVGTLD